MLSYKEYKLLNESLYGAFNLGLKGHSTVGGIVSDSSVNGTEAALEAESEDAIEEAKKGKKMKKKMIGDEEEVVKKVKVSDEDHEEDEESEEDEDHEEEDDKDDDKEDDSDDDKEDDSDDDKEDDSDDEEKSDSKEKEFAFMKKKSKKHMKKKAKKEWAEVISDLEEILEVVDDEEALTEVKKGLEMMKKGMEKGMKKNMGCGTKKCGKYMNEEEQAWWQSVNGMLNSEPNQKNWDGGWKEVGEVEQAVREGTEINEVLGFGSADYPGKPGVVSRIFKDNPISKAFGGGWNTKNAYVDALRQDIVDTAWAAVNDNKTAYDYKLKKMLDTYVDHPDSGGEGKMTDLSIRQDVVKAMKILKDYLKSGMSMAEALGELRKEFEVSYGR
jgi:hypothetical protein